MKSAGAKLKTDQTATGITEEHYRRQEVIVYATLDLLHPAVNLGDCLACTLGADIDSSGNIRKTFPGGLG